MAITTIDGLVAGLVAANAAPVTFWKAAQANPFEAAGQLHSLHYALGMPGAAVAPTSGMAGAALTSVAGQIPYTNPAAGNGYLAMMTAMSSVTGMLLLLDRLWDQSGIAVTTTTAQTINSAAWPARDRNGSTNGEDVMIGIECSTATTNGAAVTNTTMSYTDSDGNAGATGTLVSWPATAVAGTFQPFSLAAGDKGVRSIQTVTLGTSYGGGAIHLVAYRMLAQFMTYGNGVVRPADFARLGLPRLYDNTVPFLAFLPQAASAFQILGKIGYAHG